MTNEREGSCKPVQSTEDWMAPPRLWMVGRGIDQQAWAYGIFHNEAWVFSTSLSASSINFFCKQKSDTFYFIIFSAIKPIFVKLRTWLGSRMDKFSDLSNPAPTWNINYRSQHVQLSAKGMLAWSASSGERTDHVNHSVITKVSYIAPKELCLLHISSRLVAGISNLVDHAF